jgi:hypothetical protein
MVFVAVGEADPVLPLQILKPELVPQPELVKEMLKIEFTCSPSGPSVPLYSFQPTERESKV